MKEESLRPDFQRKLADYLFKVKVILGLTLLIFLLLSHYFGVVRIHTAPVILLLVAELAVFAAFFPVTASRPEWALRYNKASLFLDIFAVTTVVHYFGGIYALIWVADYMLLVAVTSLFLTKKERLAWTAFVVIAYSLLCFFEHHGVLDRHNVFRLPVSHGMDLACWSSSTALLFLTAFLSNNFVEILLKYQRLADLGRFSTELAHEIRTPLQIVEAVTHGTELPESAKQEIHSQVERIGRFIREVMALGREERQRLSRARVQDIAEVSASLVFKALRHNPKIRLARTFDTEELWVLVDVDQMTKALSNLVRNGIDSIGDAGLVEVTVNRHGFEWVQVIVRDTGVGIHPNEFERIFEPFYTTKTGMRGVGLGLAIARKFIEANGGRIDVESEVGKGSRFITWIPLCEEGDPGQPPSM
jgi:signal transduction histidine kinase